jgi:hypothetical protein
MNAPAWAVSVIAIIAIWVAIAIIGICWRIIPIRCYIAIVVRTIVVPVTTEAIATPMG